MPRPRQKYEDCVVIVFRYITGEDETSALRRFLPYLNGDRGISRDVLTSCLGEAGYMLTGMDIPDDRGARTQFWKRFQGEAVIFYTSDNASMAHAVLVRSGGIVIDPHQSSPEEGEFIDDYFKRAGGKIITIKSSQQVSQIR